MSPFDNYAPLPNEAHMDKIPYKFSKYIDQLWDRASVCDKVSRNCTVPCKRGHRVEVTMGNTRFEGVVVNPAEGDQLIVSYETAAARKCGIGYSGGKDCPLGEVNCQLEDGCSGFRMCLGFVNGKSKGCYPMQDASYYDFAKNLQRKETCPKSTSQVTYKLCKTVQTVIPAKYATAAGQVCRTK